MGFGGGEEAGFVEAGDDVHVFFGDFGALAGIGRHQGAEFDVEAVGGDCPKTSEIV